jgi:hypothetical protein
MGVHIVIVKVGQKGGPARRLDLALATTLCTFMHLVSRPYLGPITSYPVGRFSFLFCKMSSDNCRDNAIERAKFTSVALVTY